MKINFVTGLSFVGIFICLLSYIKVGDKESYFSLIFILIVFVLLSLFDILNYYWDSYAKTQDEMHTDDSSPKSRNRHETSSIPPKQDKKCDSIPLQQDISLKSRKVSR